MIRSMTGFGRATICEGHYQVDVEVRSVNHRGLRVTLNLPEVLQSLENAIERLVRSRIARGTVSVAVRCEDLSGETGYELDEAALAHYWQALCRARERLNVPLGDALDVLLALPGVIRKRVGGSEVPEALREAATRAVEVGLAELVRAREREGEFIWRDISARCDAIESALADVEARMPAMLSNYRARLRERLGALLRDTGAALREEELHREVVLFADRSDVTEEVTRLRSHLALVRSLPGREEPVGRHLEFAAQEMFREANTIASKAAGSELIERVLDLKAEIEKLREQALNVE